MDRTDPFGHGAFRVLGSEGNRIWEVAGIGSAAHGIKFGLFAGDFVIGVDAGLNFGAAGFDIERLHLRDGFADAMLAEPLVDGRGDPSTACVGGIAAVKALEEFSVLDSDDSADNSERIELFVIRVNAYSAAVRSGMECLEHGKVIRLRL